MAGLMTPPGLDVRPGLDIAVHLTDRALCQTLNLKPCIGPINFKDEVMAGRGPMLTPDL